MKKFIPYILIAAMISVFLIISFSGPFSGTMSGPKKALASEGHWYSGYWYDSTLDAFVKFGKDVYDEPLRLVPGYAVGENVAAWGDWGKIADATIGQMVAWISSFTWYISAKIFTFSGFLLDYAVDFSVKDFKEHIDQIKVINTGYKIVLNVANMLFIFILLYIAIKTILGMGGDTKKLLTNIIVVALFINFSLFMTKVIIDASNIVAMGFYNAVQTEMGTAKVNMDGNEEQKKLISTGSISTAMMAGLRLQTQIPSPDSSYNKKDSYKGLTNFNIAMNNFGGSALFLISAFVFLSVAILFIVRFVALLFYLLFSPVAFLGMISPELKEYSAKWWKGLQSQALFAPAFLFMAYLISAIVNSGQLWDAVGGDDSASTFYDAFSSSSPGAFGIIMNYVILMALMIGALILAKSMAGTGSAGVLKYTGKFQNWAQGVAGRNTLGRAASMVSDTNAMRWIESKSPTFGGFARKQFDNVAGVSFGGAKGGYTKALENKVKEQVKRSKRLEYEGKDVKKMDEIVKGTERYQKQLANDLPNLKEKAESAEKKYKTAKTKEEEAQKEYDTWQDDISENKLKQAKEEAEQAKQEFEKEQGHHKETERDIKDAKRTVEENKDKLDKLKNKYKTAYTDNLGYSWGVLNKLFSSGADAAAEIRKGKKTAKELLEEVVKETGEAPPKKEEGEKKEEKKE
ncbi:MAG: hypothetical protein HW401_113 [Parcubacteria group bacterium]|nr:hypothetical protein [Parcubacteria group bacterium]